MLGISAALAVYVEPKKHLLPLGFVFIVLTWTILTIRFVNLLNGVAEGQGVPALNATDDEFGSLLDDIINATWFLGNATAS
ncbi:hypothetical protein PRIPAC_88294 [Pristionchus pacificus]|uniref:Uncharacterized protein n=1 Tax=Pristionchus pacificus TaxID=54126 RepID=A0A2A6B3U4_PRIPA|nr:hypothetical protein PRIPAC_88294 [Pristionchus pacificus]|eukprot:PDM60531.1 hypothetical protein PRIPAC_53509 [Pristionchus pacificus]